MNRFMTAALVLALPSLAQAQTPEQRIESAKARAASAGIPVTLLEARVTDGRAKGVAPDRIAAAVEKRGLLLERTQAVLSQRGTRPTDQELDVAADAMALGVSAAVLQRLSETAGAERRGAAIAALTQLVAMDHVPAEALDRVTAALARGGNALSKLPEEAAAARQRRGPPTAARAGGHPNATGPPAGMPAPLRWRRPADRPSGG